MKGRNWKAKCRQGRPAPDVGVFNGRSLHYDKKGRAIDTYRWAALYEYNLKYRRIAHTVRVKGHEVSTIWLGIDTGMFFDGAKPIIFETMIFCSHDECECEFDLETYHWATEKRARKGHNQIVEAIRKGTLE